MSAVCFDSAYAVSARHCQANRRQTIAIRGIRSQRETLPGDRRSREEECKEMNINRNAPARTGIHTHTHTRARSLCPTAIPPTRTHVDAFVLALAQLLVEDIDHAVQVARLRLRRRKLLCRRLELLYAPSGKARARRRLVSKGGRRAAALNKEQRDEWQRAKQQTKHTHACLKRLLSSAVLRLASAASSTSRVRRPMRACSASASACSSSISTRRSCSCVSSRSS